MRLVPSLHLYAKPHSRTAYSEGVGAILDVNLARRKGLGIVGRVDYGCLELTIFGAKSTQPTTDGEAAPPQVLA
jgi:hypothetical protein